MSISNVSTSSWPRSVCVNGDGVLKMIAAHCQKVRDETPISSKRLHSRVLEERSEEVVTSLVGRRMHRLVRSHEVHQFVVHIIANFAPFDEWDDKGKNVSDNDGHMQLL